MKSKFIFFILILVFIISSSISIAKTYVVYENSNPNTYVIPQQPSGENEIYILRQKANELNPIYYKINERNEEKERLLQKTFRRIKSWKNHKLYYGYDEEVFGSKHMYLNWKDADNTEEIPDFTPTKGYEYYKGKTFLERIQKYSIK